MACFDGNLRYLHRKLAGLDVFIVQNTYRMEFSIICSKKFNTLASIPYEILGERGTFSALDTLITDLTLRYCFES